MAADIRISTTFLDHPKTIELEELIGLEGIICLLRLWCYAAEYRQKGKLKGMDSKRIELAARWAGTRGDFVKALIGIGYLTNTGDCYSLHNWRNYQGFIYFSSERKKRAQKAVNKRWEYYRKSNQDKADMATTGSILTVHTPSPSPSPSPIPSPSQLNLIQIPPTEEVNLMDEFQTLWNETAEAWGLPELKTMTPKRKAKFKTRMASKFFRENWKQALLAIGDFPFLHGENDRKWRANPNWFLRSDEAVANLIEGSY